MRRRIVLALVLGFACSRSESGLGLVSMDLEGRDGPSEEQVRLLEITPLPTP
jgi:hypothetical protein